MIGHLIGAAAEVGIMYGCVKLGFSHATCRFVSYASHECVIEPAVNIASGQIATHFLLGGSVGTEGHTFDWSIFIFGGMTNVASVFLISQCAPQAYLDHSFRPIGDIALGVAVAYGAYMVYHTIKEYIAGETPVTSDSDL